jgi:hypothetical protein
MLKLKELSIVLFLGTSFALLFKKILKMKTLKKGGNENGKNHRN